MNTSNRWTRRQTLWLLAGLSSSLAVNACTKSTSTTSNTSNTSASSDASSTPVKVSLAAVAGWIGYTPLYIAIDKGFFKELGVDLSLVTFGTNPEVRAAFAAGKVDGQTTVTSEAVLQAETGKDFKIVLVEDNSLGADGILARNSIPDIKSFKGKTIAVEVGGVSHFFLLQVLKEAGLSSNDVKLINVSPDAAAAAYSSGKVDIAVTYEPFLGKAKSTQTDGRVIYDSSKMPTAITDLYLFDSQFVAQNPQAITAFVKGIFKGLEFLKTNEQEALEIAAKQLGITGKELQEQLKGVRLVDLPTNKEMLGSPNSNLYLLNSLKELVSFLKDQGQIKTTPDMSKYIDPSFVKALS
jgi:NitT/TauT family transport system substrate-binding protein